MPYLHNKSTGRTKETGKKPALMKTITAEQWQNILQAIEDDAANPRWERDWAIVFLGAALGLRRGEICLLERNHFRDLEKYDVIHLPTLKQSEKLQFNCKHCDKKARLKLLSAGLPYKCSKCGKTSTAPSLRPGQAISGVVEIPVDVVEPKTVGFIFDYIEKMRPDQRFLFEGRTGYHVSISHINNIFNTYAIAAGLDPKISFHSLRHNRGVKLYSMFKDSKLCQIGLRHKNIASTQIYANLDQESKDHYKAELDKKMFDPMKKRKRK